MASFALCFCRINTCFMRRRIVLMLAPLTAKFKTLQLPNSFARMLGLIPSRARDVPKIMTSGAFSSKSKNGSSNGMRTKPFLSSPTSTDVSANSSFEFREGRIEAMICSYPGNKACNTSLVIGSSLEVTPSSKRKKLPESAIPHSPVEANFRKRTPPAVTTSIANKAAKYCFKPSTLDRLHIPSALKSAEGNTSLPGRRILRGLNTPYGVNLSTAKHHLN